jgi:predicted NUDIX family NTP pyrophosphohydrolase
MGTFVHGMTRKRSAGLLLYRRTADGGVEVMLGHMGGPFWTRKDETAWSIPKGEYLPGEEPLAAARREFEEEIGRPVPDGKTLIELGEVRQAAGKIVTAWALEADMDVSRIQSNMFEMEWPKRSGKMGEFPEMDRAAWFDVETARRKLVRAQVAFLDRLVERLPSADG